MRACIDATSLVIIQKICCMPLYLSVCALTLTLFVYIYSMLILFVLFTIFSYVFILKNFHFNNIINGVHECAEHAQKHSHASFILSVHESELMPVVVVVVVVSNVCFYYVLFVSFFFFSFFFHLFVKN